MADKDDNEVHRRVPQDGVQDVRNAWISIRPRSLDSVEDHQERKDICDVATWEVRCMSAPVGEVVLRSVRAYRKQSPD